MKDESYPGEADEAARDEASCHEPHMAHTPGPWGMPDSGKGLISKKSPHGWDGMIATVDCGDYARSRAEGLANAAFIVRACNSHAAMLEALKLSLDYYRSHGTKKYNPYEVEQSLEQAIRLAEGRG